MLSLKSIWYYISMILLPYGSGDVDFTRLLYCNSESKCWIVGLSVLRTVQLGVATVVISVKNKIYIYSALLTLTQKNL